MSLTNIFPEAIDSTMLAAYGSCPKLFQQSYVDNWKAGQADGGGEHKISIHLHAGKCFASGIEAARNSFYNDNRNNDDAVAFGANKLLLDWGDYETDDKDTKTLDRMLGALEYYFDQYPLDTDHARVAHLGGKYAIEFSFAIPAPILHPTTGNPILICGRFDAAVEYASGLYAMDEKTTSMLGASWGKQWDLRGQFSCYAWALREHGYKPAGTIVRGVSILKNSYGAAEAIVSQPNWKIDRWYEQMMKRIEKMKADYLSGDFNYDLGESCNHYGSCAFKQVCLAPDPAPWLTSYFHQEVWSPLVRH